MRIAIRLNALALSAIGAILACAFHFQIALAELPRPLCLLQHAGFVAFAFGGSGACPPDAARYELLAAAT